MDRDVDDLERCEYLVRVDWLHTVDKEAAVWDPTMFANQVRNLEERRVGVVMGVWTRA